MRMENKSMYPESFLLFVSILLTLGSSIFIMITSIDYVSTNRVPLAAIGYALGALTALSWTAFNMS